jgi:hypothetical protein
VTLKLFAHPNNETFARALLDELNHALATHENEFPLHNLASPGWHPISHSQARIENLECQFTNDGFVRGTFAIHFQEFLQRDCQDLLTEAQHSGTMNFRLNRSTGQIQFTVTPHPTREYDPEEF